MSATSTAAGASKSAVKLRAATRRDAADLAILDNLASHGMSLWFWQGAVMRGKATDAYDWGRARMAQEDAIFGWSNAVMAESDGAIVGSLVHYKMPHQEPDEEKAAPELFVPVFQLFDMAVGHWFIDSLAVYEEFRGLGIGATLLDHALATGAAQGCETISLVAEDQNKAALALYRSRGFEVAAKRPYIPINDHATSEEWLLLSASLNQSAQDKEI